jgi:Glycosyl transferases group 1
MKQDSPFIPEVGIIALVPDRWSDPWMPRHHLMSGLGRYFNVAWVNRPPYWRDLFRDLGGLAIRPFEPMPGVVVVGPDVLSPRFYDPRVRRIVLGMRLRRARAALRRRGARRIVLYLWRPEFEQALDLIPHDASFYHIDDEYSFSPDDPPTTPEEERVMRRVDQVFIHSRELMNKKGFVNPNTLRVPNGVDYESFANHWPEPHDLAAIPRPRIGYTGWLKRQLNWPLLVALAKARPEWSFVFAGPRTKHPEIQEPIREMEALGNVHFLGRKSVADLARYPQHFDVCMMPYQVDGYTRYIYPLKLHEYLAGGRPIIGTPLPTLSEFRHVITVANGFEDWLRELESMVRAGGGQSRSQRILRQRVAEEHDWRRMCSLVARVIAERMGVAVLDRLESRIGDEAYLITDPDLSHLTA